MARICYAGLLCSIPESIDALCHLNRTGATSGGKTLMFLMALLNGLLGAICGLRFKVAIIGPLLLVALIEVAILKHVGAWSSAFWSTIVLMTTPEIGYLIGSAAGALWLPLIRGRILRHIQSLGHGRLSPH